MKVWTIEELTDKLVVYENKYNLSTAQFYRMYQDQLMATSDDFSDWALIYYLLTQSLGERIWGYERINNYYFNVTIWISDWL